MDSAAGDGKIPRPLHCRHNHFYYVSPHCPFHRSILQPKNHSRSCIFSTSYPSHPNPGTGASVGPDQHLSIPIAQPNQELDLSSFIVSNSKFGHYSSLSESRNYLQMIEEDEEPVFVLTDEWRDLFAKSEAKRRLAKKQAKKRKN